MKNLVFNIELTTRCNYRCITCPHKEFHDNFAQQDMSKKTFKKLIFRIKQIARTRKIREIINSGYGESFLCTDLRYFFEEYAKLKIYMYNKYGYMPIISLVTNASLITHENIHKIITGCAIDILKISFPTCNVKNYAKIMNDGANGFCKKVKKNIKICMEYNLYGDIPKLRFHISPPTKEVARDFHATVMCLQSIAKNMGLDHIDIVTFPAASNRAGDVNADEGLIWTPLTDDKIDTNYISEFNVFYPHIWHVLEAANKTFPCLWRHASVSIDARGGYRHCINDTFSTVDMGNIFDIDIYTHIKRLAKMSSTKQCMMCNQHPLRMGDELQHKFYRILCKLYSR